MGYISISMATVEDFRNEWDNSLPYVVAYTSGSTGAPKEIQLPKSDMLRSAEATVRRFGISRDSVLGLPLSVDYIAGKMMCVRTWISGAELVTMPVSNRLVIDRRYDLLAIVPSQVDSLIESCSNPTLCGNIIIGGAALDENRRRALIEREFKAYQTYGMTETCSHVALQDISDESKLYRAMPGISFETDPRGCLVIIAPGFSFGRLVTNDIVDLVGVSSFKWLGRYDNVINSGGIKIAAEQLETEITPIIGCPFYVTAAPDEKWGEVPVVVAVCSQGECDGILARLKANIDHRRCPKKIVAVNQMDYTANGKIIRKKLSEIISRIC